MVSTKMMLFNSKPYDVDSFRSLESDYSQMNVELIFEEKPLDESTAELAKGCSAVCVFVNDKLDKAVIECLKRNGTQLVVLRCAGFDRVDLSACEEVGMSVARVPVYSPNAVAEHAVALVMALNRRILLSRENILENDFSLSKSLLGFDMAGKTVGLLGTGNIGRVAGQIFLGFGCKIICYDPIVNESFAQLQNVSYASLDEVLAKADILSLHLPLFPSTKYVINKDSIQKMKEGAILVNTSRGGLVDTRALIDAVKSGHLRGAGLDVYENESDYFFEKHSEIDDPLLKELISTPNIMLTAHQAFFTEEALAQIARVTMTNVYEFFVEGKKMNQMTNTALKK